MSVDLGFVGLGRMGAAMVRRLLEDGHRVVAYNRTAERTREIMTEGADGAFSLADLAGRLRAPRAIWVMVPVGDATEAQIDELLKHLGPGDAMVDGGNADYRDTIRRHAKAAECGVQLVDVGVSGVAGPGGIGAGGYCLMVGGEPEPVKRLEPIFRSLAPEGGYLHAGGPGAGHYLKMIQGGIRAGLMQAYAEGFDILHASDYELDLAAVADLWNHGSPVRSWLLEATATALAEDRELERIGNPGPESGEGRGTIQEALDRDVPAPLITLALLNRFRARQDGGYQARLLTALRNESAGHVVKTEL